MQACHTCDNPVCINPSHLFAGTPLANQRDKVAKGRQARGERNGGGGRLTTSDVTEIRSMLSTGMTCTAVAEHFPVTRTMIGHIKNGRAWA